VANVLAKASATKTVYEPDGPISDLLGAMVANRLGPFPVLQPGERNGWYRLVWDLAFAGGWPWARVEVARSAGRGLVKIPPSVRDGIIAVLAAGTAQLQPRREHVVVKSVNSAFSLEWVAQKYQPRVAVLRRNPLNIVSSWLVLDMGDRWPVGNDPWVRREYLDSLGLSPPQPSSSKVSRIAWDVGLLTLALKRTTERHPDWLQVSYDELSADPEPGCQALFQQLGLGWTDGAAEFLREADDPNFVVVGGHPRTHPNALTATEATSRRSQQGSQYKRRLSDEQIVEVTTILERFDLGAWGPPPL
jgi:hypothetical protein